MEPEVGHELLEELPIKVPIRIPKYESDLEHNYAPKKEYHYQPIIKHEYHYEPKKEEPKEKKKEHLIPDINVEGIIDDIQQDLKKTGYIAKA